jgi:hypothetical protein
LKAHYDIAARHWEQPPRPLFRLSTGTRWQDEPAPPYYAERLEEFDRLATLAFLHQMLGEQPYCDKALQLFRPWVDTLRPMDDPMEATRLEPALWAYRLLRPSASAEDRQAIDPWWLAVAAALQASRDLSQPQAQNHVNAHRLKTVGLIGYAVGQSSLVQWARVGLKQQLMDSLLPNGETRDYALEHSLEAQLDVLRPLLTLNLALIEDGEDLYRWGLPTGASLQLSAAWLLARLGQPPNKTDAIGSRLAPGRVRHVLELVQAWVPDLKLATAPGWPGLRSLLNQAGRMAA